MSLPMLVDQSVGFLKSSIFIYLSIYYIDLWKKKMKNRFFDLLLFCSL